MAEQSFVVVRLGSLGDIVHTFPAVSGLRDSFPTADIVWLTHPRWVDLVACSGLATEIWPIDSRDLASVRHTLKKVRARRWDAAIDYQGLWKAALLPFFGGVARRIGFASATIREFGVPILYTDRVASTAAHIADQNGELSLRAGAKHSVGRVALQVADAESAQVRSDLKEKGLSGYVVLSPGGGWRSKCWPAERFGALCERIHGELGLSCVINYGPSEEALARMVQAASGEANPIAYDGELGQLLALLRDAQCIVGGDTGPLHLAVTLGTPAVALFGPTDPARNGPYPRGDIVLRSPNAITTYERSETTDPALLELSVEIVFEAVKQRLEGRA